MFPPLQPAQHCNAMHFPLSKILIISSFYFSGENRSAPGAGAGTHVQVINRLFCSVMLLRFLFFFSKHQNSYLPRGERVWNKFDDGDDDHSQCLSIVCARHVYEKLNLCWRLRPKKINCGVESNTKSWKLKKKPKHILNASKFVKLTK